MREYKFRGKDIETGEWVYGNLIINIYRGGWCRAIQSENDSDDEYDLSLFIYNVDSDTVCQYTGLKDKNGVEIYEGDILKDSKGNIGMIIFEYYMFRIIFNNISYPLYEYRNVLKNAELLEG